MELDCGECKVQLKAPLCEVGQKFRIYTKKRTIPSLNIPRVLGAWAPSRPGTGRSALIMKTARFGSGQHKYLQASSCQSVRHLLGLRVPEDTQDQMRLNDPITADTPIAGAKAITSAEIALYLGCSGFFVHAVEEGESLAQKMEAPDRTRHLFAPPYQ